ncbi:hypothetical protein ANCCAN_22667 [Ancylostoma caninum]|uniref:Uncharacterized protein n=1 Tax=Ancylostoma caninum TaxID=29170 RepID=A0A368FHD3_ANCCA|nr:hypothetical protein ANCCAN_22667 [Ancylostoma caninum]
MFEEKENHRLHGFGGSGCDVLKIDGDPTIDLDTITTPRSRRVGDTREERVGSEVRGDGGW